MGHLCFTASDISSKNTQGLKNSRILHLVCESQQTHPPQFCGQVSLPTGQLAHVYHMYLSRVKSRSGGTVAVNS